VFPPQISELTAVSSLLEALASLRDRKYHPMRKSREQIMTIAMPAKCDPPFFLKPTLLSGVPTLRSCDEDQSCPGDLPYRPRCNIRAGNGGLSDHW
jgi:hypothetical protein